MEKEILPERKAWTQEYYKEILRSFVARGYNSCTFSEYFNGPVEKRKKTLLLRVDVDERFDRIPVLLEAQQQLGLKATYFIHIHATFNLLFYDNYKIIKDLLNADCEIALHSNFVEFGKYFDEDPIRVIKREKAALEAVIDRPVLGHACHRDVNYIYNSLPYLVAVGPEKLGLLWNAYDPIFTSDNILYVNESLAPHLKWGKVTPEEAMATGKNICLMVHPHWWHRRFHTGT